MRLTKSKLKQIIKEELKSALDETSLKETPKYEPLEKLPSTYREPEPGKFEKRIRKLEDMVWSLLDKLSSGPMTPEEAEKIRADMTPFGEGKQN